MRVDAQSFVSFTNRHCVFQSDSCDFAALQHNEEIITQSQTKAIPPLPRRDRMTFKLYEVVRSDPISSGNAEIDARDVTEAVLFAATDEVLKTIRDGFSFDPFSITLETENIARLNYAKFESSGDTDPIFFEGIEGIE